MKKIFFDSKERWRSWFLIIIAILSVMLLSAFSRLVGNMLPDTYELNKLVYSILCIVLTLIVFSLIFKYLFKNEKFETIDCFSLTKKSIIMLAGGLLTGIICFSLVVLPMYLTGQYEISFNNASIYKIFVNLIFFMAVAVGEELLTRGVMQHALMRLGKWPSLIITSIIFGLLHIENPNASITGILGVLLAGIVLGMTMYATNSITFAIGFHLTWNWMQGSIFGITTSGIDLGDNLYTTTVIGQNTLITGGDFGAEASLSCLIVLILVSILFYFYGKKKNRF